MVVFKGKVGSLRRFKDDAREVTNGMECGISIANYGDIKVGDVIEAFSTVRVAAEVIATDLCKTQMSDAASATRQ